MADFIKWGESSLLNIKVSKAKKMIIDFRRSPTVSSSLLINNQAVEQVQHYKYLGTVIDDKLAFGPQVQLFQLCAKKANQRMRKLFAFNVENTFMRMCYSCL